MHHGIRIFTFFRHEVLRHYPTESFGLVFMQMMIPHDLDLTAHFCAMHRSSFPGSGNGVPASKYAMFYHRTFHQGAPYKGGEVIVYLGDFCLRHQHRRIAHLQDLKCEQTGSHFPSTNR